jgi:four helix bundle protein
MKENIIRDKSYKFALEIIQLCQELKDRKEYQISNQLLRSGTSIGANIEEALAGQSRKDFISKMSIASKEARETNYWLRLLRDSRLLKNSKFNLIDESDELKKILTKIVKTSSLN